MYQNRYLPICKKKTFLLVNEVGSSFRILMYLLCKRKTATTYKEMIIILYLVHI